MSEWLEEVENLERICENTDDCKNCKLGYCIKESGKDQETNWNDDFIENEVIMHVYSWLYKDRYRSRLDIW